MSEKVKAMHREETKSPIKTVDTNETNLFFFELEGTTTEERLDDLLLRTKRIWLKIGMHAYIVHI
jgi:hypothetical protein